MPGPDAPDPNAVSSAVAWLQNTLLGTVATTVAIITIASFGILMLSGRIDVRRAAQVIFGCFIIFGATTIAIGIMAALNGAGPGRSEDAAAARPSSPAPTQLPAYPKANSTSYDPYAGAALPPR